MKAAKIALIIFLIFGLSRIGFCENITVTVAADSTHPGAKATVSLNQDLYYGGKNRIIFKVEGLKPDNVYTVWLAKASPSEPLTGLGDSPYLLNVDANLGATYVAAVEAYKLNAWQSIKIMLHKDANPQNLGKDNLITVFTISLKELLSGKE